MLVAALALFAAAGPPPALPARPPTEVSAFTVYPPTLPPKVLVSYPADGAAIPPGVVVIKVTFDQKMQPTGFDFGPSDGC